MWWDNLSNLQQVSFIIAISATIIMVIFIILMLIGMDGAESFDGDVDIDIDFDGDMDFEGDMDFDDVDGASGVDAYNHDSILSISGLRILTIRGVLAFFSIGGWTVYLLADNVKTWLAVFIGVVAGAIASVLLAMAMKAIMKLESSGNLDYKGAIGKIAVVYIRIPKNALGKGKIIFNHQGKMLEVDAITKGNEDIIAKKEVKIIGLENETTLVVEKL
ncbi:hypothetical protein RJI07_08190 [Mycoplasmatota bacterium WC30]